MIDEYLMALVTESAPQDQSEALLPTALARACVAVLPVDGAGLSLSGALRVPLGSSDQAASQVERLQVTLGEGPCLTASATDAPLVAGPAELAERWPVFYEQLVRTTPFRSIGSWPVRLSDQLPFGALDLYSVSPDANPFLLGAEVSALVEHIGGLMLAISGTRNATVSGGIWTPGTPAATRMTVWRAIGMITAQTGQESSVVLALLRSYAYSHETTLDDIAGQVAERRLSIDYFLAG